MTEPRCARCGEKLAIGALLKWNAQEQHGMFRVYCRNAKCPMTSGIALVAEQALDECDVYEEGDHDQD